MSLEETSKLVVESQKLVESNEDINANTPLILNMLLRIVSSVDSRLKTIETAVGSISDIKKELLLMSSKVRELETLVTETVKSQKQLETSCQALSDMFDDVKQKFFKRDEVLNKHDEQLIKQSQEIKKYSENINLMSKQMVNLEKQLDNLKTNAYQTDNQTIQDLQDTVLDLQCRSMKNNLIFTNLAEQRTEDVELKLRKFIYEQLGIEHYIEFGNVHRFGKRSNDKPRPIVARFLYHKDLRMVLDNAKWLKNTPFGIHEQFPNIIEQRRRKLYPIQKEAKLAGRQAVLVRDRLFVDGNLYTLNECVKDGNDKPKSENKFGYRDSLLTTPKETDRPFKRLRRLDSSPIVNDNHNAY